jgi:hypothetical protein
MAVLAYHCDNVLYELVDQVADRLENVEWLAFDASRTEVGISASVMIGASLSPKSKRGMVGKALVRRE